VRRLLLALVVTFAVGTGACSSEDDPGTPEAGGFVLTSTAFGEGEEIPPDHALDGPNISPPLTWSGVPDDTAELAITVIDPDASNFVHWLVWGIEPTDAAIEAGAVPTGATVGLNQFGEARWDGPQPPAGDEHTYVFTVHALPRPLGLDSSTPASDALAAIAAAATASAELRGQYTSP
jgi:Raf kinase inhibitor-like YbhB/YbcL family protein